MDKNKITIDEANKKAKQSLNGAWLSIIILLWGSTFSFFLAPVVFGVVEFYIINYFANKALSKNTSIPKTALKAKKIAKILLIIGVGVSLIMILDARFYHGSFKCLFNSC